MSAQAILDAIHGQPFVPFKIHLSDGRSYDIRHPELIKVGRSYVMVFYPTAKNFEIIDRDDTLSLLHITGLQPIEAATSVP